jgi:hypothetical protein
LDLSGDLPSVVGLEIILSPKNEEQDGDRENRNCEHKDVQQLAFVESDDAAETPGGSE